MRPDIERFYHILDLEPGASESEIKEAYRTRAAVKHPDQNDSEEAEEAFKQIKNAKQIILNIEVKGMSEEEALIDVFGYATHFKGQPGDGVHQTGYTDPDDPRQTGTDSERAYAAHDRKQTGGKSRKETGKSPKPQWASPEKTGRVVSSTIHSISTVIVIVSVAGYLLGPAWDVSTKMSIGVMAAVIAIASIMMAEQILEKLPDPDYIEGRNLQGLTISVVGIIAFHAIPSYLIYDMAKNFGASLTGLLVTGGIIFGILAIGLHFALPGWGTLIGLGIVVGGLDMIMGNQVGEAAFGLMIFTYLIIPFVLGDIWLSLRKYMAEPMAFEDIERLQDTSALWTYFPLALFGTLTAVAWEITPAIIIWGFWATPPALLLLTMARAVYMGWDNAESDTSSQPDAAGSPT